MVSGQDAVVDRPPDHLRDGDLAERPHESGDHAGGDDPAIGPKGAEDQCPPAPTTVGGIRHGPRLLDQRVKVPPR